VLRLCKNFAALELRGRPAQRNAGEATIAARAKRL